MIPTAITRWHREGQWRQVINRSINIRNGEALSIYHFKRLVIRWSPIQLVLKRIFIR